MPSFFGDDARDSYCYAYNGEPLVVAISFTDTERDRNSNVHVNFITHSHIDRDARTDILTHRVAN